MSNQMPYNFEVIFPFKLMWEKAQIPRVHRTCRSPILLM